MKETSGLANYQKMNRSPSAVRCPFGKHKFDAVGKCACGHYNKRIYNRARRVAKAFYEESLSRP